MATTALSAQPTTPPIIKQPGALRPAPHLLDYDSTCASFSWSKARQQWLDGLPDGKGLNIAHEAVDRHVQHGRGEKTALRWPACGPSWRS
jgi:acetyl-CoA synthetase